MDSKFHHSKFHHHHTTIEQHIMDQQDQNPHLHHDVANILYDINLASKYIRKEVMCAGLSQHCSGLAGHQNTHGEDVKKLDIFANDSIKTIIGKNGRFAVMGSEEEDDIILPQSKTSSNQVQKSQYVLLFDPLDGSSNIDVNVSVGTIFSIYKVKSGGKIDDCLQKGVEQIAAGYVIYGSSVVMVYTAKNGVHGFTYDPMIGEFLLSHPDIKTPNTPTYYSINEGLTKELNPSTTSFLDYLKGNHPDNPTPISGRYVGSLVADFHRNLIKGGIYIYPATTKNKNGKLRLLYEANPLALIIEQAGGSATDGTHRILDIEPTTLHQKTPLYIGSRDIVAKAREFELQSELAH